MREVLAYSVTDKKVKNAKVLNVRKPAAQPDAVASSPAKA
jgi:hypothetical protein